MSRSRPCLALAAVAALTAGAAQAQSVEFQVEVVSDYRFRGYSVSDDGPALQGGATLDVGGGLYADVWASTIEEYGVGADGKGATVELDVTVGRAWSLGAYDLDLALSAYTYPGGQDVNYVEIPVSIARTAGDWTWTLGGAYAPRQDSLGGADNSYVFGAVALAPAKWPIGLDASLGWEDGAFADRKLDWSLGVSRAVGPLTLSVRYVDADDPAAKAAVVGSIGVAF